MRTRYTPNHTGSAAIRCALILATVVILSGCDQVIQVVLGVEYPTGLEASDGEYRDRIVLTWDGISDTDSNGNPRTLSYYVIERDLVAIDNATGTSYTDTDPLVLGQLYDYRIRAVFTDALSSNWSPVETGYVMDARPALIHHQPFTYEYAVSNGDWLEFPAQEGWYYRVYYTGSAVPTQLVREGDLTAASPASSSDGSGNYYRYLANSSRLYYLQLGGSGTVSIVHE